uniref:sigma-70 family RNA polymerase sigma factor n=1 Tax=Candidatus Enterococcus willemsii TaxID=1857215 RepID=UPI00403F5C66
MSEQELTELVNDYQRLFYKVLRRCSIFPGQNDFDDYLQELRILFYVRAKKYPSRGTFEAENNISYLFKYLLWYVVDQKRKFVPQLEEVQEETLRGQMEERFEDVETMAAFDAFYHRLLPKDQKKVLALLFDDQLSRQNRSRYRQYFRKKKHIFFKKE